ncbi:rhodanese-like domain-containing protein [Paenibacillus spiritus]|uniref:Rhodanese-like domain-containing protein n=1 Tax=Paenibacillus spiritus TaxID=2496557 RepID=A0A5J5G2E2_9BACL|nr:rhodanese-like domain-containing protein [Paenibacillus spiritus]KAA9000956.1 rhodanese-like domain-containing protein [Paenibacillus spiritus]
MTVRPKSQTSASPAADPAAAAAHFQARAAFETDVADVAYDLHHGVQDFVLLDVRDAQSYEEAHLPGARSLPGGFLRGEAPPFGKEDLLVVYCWGPACNGATKAAGRLAAKGYRVKEMLGGIEYWRLEGGELEGTLREAAPLHYRMPAPGRN